MMSRKWFVALGLSLVVLAGNGCRSRLSSGGDGDDILDPIAFGEDGDYPLGARTQDGTPVTDVQFENVLFSYDSFQIANSEIGKIERVADYMRRKPDVRLIIEGHCDERGSREYNMSLGEYRALAVRAHLIGLDVEGSRIQTRSFGEEVCLDPGHDESAWRVNRRGEFKLYR